MRRRLGRRSQSTPVTNQRDSNTVRFALSRTPSGPGEIVTRVLTFNSTVSSNSAGVIAQNIAMYPSSGWTGWSPMSILYDEFRVVGGEVKFFCYQQNSITSQSQPLICVYDNDDSSTVLPNTSEALNYRTKMQFASIWDNQRFPTLTATCFSQGNTSTGALWATTATPSQYPHSFKLYGVGLTVSTSYLSYTAQMVVQFRGPI